MIIGIDGNEANIENKVGIGRYAYQLLCNIHEVQNAKKDLSFRIYLKDHPATSLPPETSWWKYKWFGPKPLWTQLALPLTLFKEGDKPSVFFSPSHYAPRFAPSPTVISIMDVSYLIFPEMFRKKDLLQLQSWTAYSVKQAAKILTISQFSKQAIIDHYNIPSEKVVVTYPGFDSTRFVPIPKSDKIFNFDYILFVGTLQPRKNIVRLIEAYYSVLKHHSTLKLVIVGKKGWLFEKIFQRVRELRLDRQIVFMDYADDRHMPSLYQYARCLVLPSLYEGFGLPVVEAMACGCPVVVSNTSSLPEVAGNAGVYVNPTSVSELEKGILTAAYDNTKRNLLIQNGLKQASIFSWKTCARETLDVLKGIESQRL